MIGLLALLASINLLGAGPVSAAPTVTVFTACLDDNFVLPTESLSPSAALDGITLGTPKDCDDPRIDKRVQHTFTDLPDCIIGATLETRLRAGGSSLAQNDNIILTFIEPSDSGFPLLGPELWGRRIGSGFPVTSPGIFPFNWTPGTVAVITLNLGNLPLTATQQLLLGVNDLDLIPAMNQHGFLDFDIQDDTDVDYMILTVETESLCVVDIDIKPSSDPNSINTNSNGTIPVAILSTGDFDAPNEVDKTSLTFGRTGDEQSLAKCPKSAEDVNDDGLQDLVCHFKTREAGFQMGDTKGILKGETVDGRTIEGSDLVRIVR